MATGGIINADVSGSIIGVFFDVYNEMGHGFLEYLYGNAMEKMLTRIPHKVDREKSVPIYFRGEPIGRQRIDMIVDDAIIVEIKATKDLPEIAMRQLDNYLKGTGIEVGLLLHFGHKPKFYRRVWTKKQIVLRYPR
jgi:GxxExxY protein